MESTTDFFVAQLQQIAYFSGGTESRNRPTPVPSSPLFQNKSVAKISVPRLVVFSSKTKNTCCCLFGTQELLQVVGHGIFSEAMSCFMLRNTSAWWCHKDLVNYCRGKHIYIYTYCICYMSSVSFDVSQQNHAKPICSNKNGTSLILLVMSQTAPG